MTRNALLYLLFATLGVLPLRAIEAQDQPCRVMENESPNAAFLRCSTAAEQKAPQEAQEEVQEAFAEAKAKVHAQASSAAAADASGSRVSDSLTDLLPLLQGAITPANTSGEGMPIVLNFNSPPFLRGKTSLQATLVEPAILSPLAELFPSAVRDTETKSLLDRAGGFGDTTYSLGWSPVRRAGNWSTTKQLFGREPETYRPLIEDYSNNVLLPIYTSRVQLLLAQAQAEYVPKARDLAALLNLDFDKLVNETTFLELRERAQSTNELTKANELINSLDALGQTEASSRSRAAEELARLLEITVEEVQSTQSFAQLREQARLKSSRELAKGNDLVDRLADEMRQPADRENRANTAAELGRLLNLTAEEVSKRSFSQLRKDLVSKADQDRSQANELFSELEEDDLQTETAIANDLGQLLDVPPEKVLEMKASGHLREQARLRTTARAIDLIDGIASNIEELARLERDAEAVLKEREDLAHRFAVLIGNQPELLVRTSYRDADASVGPRDFAVSVTYQAGTLNFNSLLDDYRALVGQWPDTGGLIPPDELNRRKAQAFNDITERATKGDLWRSSYAITYKKISDYDETFTYKLDGVDTTAALELPGVEQWQARINFSHLAGPEPLAADARPRMEYSIEGIWVQEDGDVLQQKRHKDRILGRITYTVPTTDNLTFPVSIVFANRPEFLMEDEDFKNQLSAHVGLSYKVPRPKNAPKKTE